MNKRLAGLAAYVFNQYPTAEAVLVCDDGNVFLEANSNLAEHHCRQMRLPAPVRVTRRKVLAQGAVDEANTKVAEMKAREAEEKDKAEALAKVKDGVVADLVEALNNGEADLGEVAEAAGTTKAEAAKAAPVKKGKKK